MKGAILLGFRGAGKTTLGKLLEEAGLCRFLDLDSEWELRNSESILQHVARCGIESFRAQEESLLRESQLAFGAGGGELPLLVAPGGGIVDWEPSRRLLENSPLGKIYLEVGPEELWNRLKDYPERRKIGELNSLKDLERLFAQRRKHYEKIASYRVNNQDISRGLIELKHLLRSLWPSVP